MFTEKSRTENGRTARTKYEFGTAGELLASRVLRCGDAADCAALLADDVLTVFKYAYGEAKNNGRLLQQRVYGGDGATLSVIKEEEQDETFVAPSQNPSYLTKYGYSAEGVLLSTDVLDTSSADCTIGTDLKAPLCPVLLRTLDRAVDKASGLVTESRDSSGLATNYAYDSAFRLVSVTPPVGVASSSYQYSPATSTQGPTVLETISAGTSIGTNWYKYDRLGRLVRVSKSFPAESGGGWSVTDTSYDPLGRTRRVSQPFLAPASDPANTTSFTTTTDYDVFGRPSTVTAPNTTKTTWTYAGTRLTKRKTKVHTDGADDRDVEVEEKYDALGRLMSVTEPFNSTAAGAPNGGVTVTKYGYDVGGHLVTVDMEAKVDTTSPGDKQERRFVYDRRGFLLSEKHPESGETKYWNHDPKGHAKSSSNDRLSADGQILRLVFDPADRLLDVGRIAINAPADTVPQWIKRFKFATDNVVTASGTNFSKGKLQSTERHNFIGTGDIVVKEFYSYETPSGQASHRKTTVSAGSSERTFEAKFDYDPWKQPRTTWLPTCASTPCAAPAETAASLTNVRSQGLLTSILRQNGSASTTVGAFTYHPSGMVKTVDHRAAPLSRDHYASANGLARPSAIAFCGDLVLAPLPERVDGIAASGAVELTVQEQSGSKPLSYQWFRGAAPGVAVTNGSGRSLTVTVDSPGWYRVKVTDACGTTAVSTDTQVTFNGCMPPQSPLGVRDTTVQKDAPATLAVTAPAPGWSYEWALLSKAGVACATLDGEGCSWAALSSGTGGVTISTNGSSLTIGPFGAEGVRFYRVTVRALCGEAVTGVAKVTVVACPDQPVINVQPAPLQFAMAGAQTPLSVVATLATPGVLPLVNWFSGGYGPDGSPAGSGSNVSVAPRETTRYYARVTASSNLPCVLPVNSDLATIVVTGCNGVSITNQPADRRVVEGMRAELSLSATAPSPYGFRWYEGVRGDRSQFMGYTTATEPKIPTRPLMDTARFWAEVAAPTCAVATRQITVTVCHPPRVTGASVKVAGEHTNVVTPGQEAVIQLDATGDALVYTWYGRTEGGQWSPLTGEGTARLVRWPAETMYYKAIVTGECGTAESAPIHLRYCVPPAVTTATTVPLKYTTVDPAAVKRLTVDVVSPITVTYAWQYCAGGCAGLPASSRQWNPIDGQRVTSTAGSPKRSTVDLSFLAAGVYDVQVIVRNDYCSTASNLMRVEVCQPPSAAIRQIPIGSPTSGQTVWLTADTDQPTSATYRWYKSGVSEPFAFNPSVQVAPTVRTMYQVKISNGSCETMSAGFWVDVCGPTISGPPLDQTIQYGASATMTVAATVDSAPTYQWYEGTAGDTSKPVTGATGHSVIVTPHVTTPYWARVRTACGPGASSSAGVVTVAGCVPPTVHSQTPSQAIEPYQTKRLLVSATGTFRRYQWYVFDPAHGSEYVPIGGATFEYVDVTPVTSWTGYYVRVWNDCGSVATPVIGITVNYCTPPSVSTPSNVEFRTGQSVQFAVTAGGTSPSIQWYAIDPPGSAPVGIAGATGSTLTVVPNTDRASYYAQVYNGCGQVTSAAATATLCNPPTINAQTSSASMREGQWAQLWVQAVYDATNPISIQWFKVLPSGSVEALPGQVYSTLTIAPPVTTVYYARLQNRCGTTYSWYMQVTVNPCPKPVITSHPASQQLTTGNSTTLTVSVQNEPGLTYEWYSSTAGGAWQFVQQGSSAINVAPTVTSSYRCDVRNECGLTQSGVAEVTVVGPVCQPPNYDYYSIPSAVYYWPGEIFTVTVNAWGSNLSYQWYKIVDGRPTYIRGGVYPTLIDGSDADGTVYWLRIWNACGDIYSHTFTAFDLSAQSNTPSSVPQASLTPSLASPTVWWATAWRVTPDRVLPTSSESWVSAGHRSGEPLPVKSPFAAFVPARGRPLGLPLSPPPSSDDSAQVRSWS